MIARPQPARPAAPRLRLLPGRRRARLRMPPWAAFTVLAVLMFFALVFSRIHLDRSAFELRDLRTRVAAEEAVYHQLRLDVVRLETPGRIYRQAKRMGLVLPDGGVEPVVAPRLVPDTSTSDPGVVSALSPP